jgi:ferredoxin
MNLNHQPSKGLILQNRWKIGIARQVLDTDLLINLPKLKTHQEFGLSLAVKNLMGCVSGMDKKIVHEDLVSNLVEVALYIRPQLSILDGNIAMEGNGPGDGNPRYTGFMAAGTDVFCLDLVVSRLVGFSPSDFPMVRELQRRGIVTSDRLDEIREKVVPLAHIEPAPPRTRMSRFLGHNRFTRLRDLTRWLFYRKSILDICYRYKIIQDIYQKEESGIQRLVLDTRRCTHCLRCIEVCPCDLPVLSPDFDFTAGKGCIRCLSCALICPAQAIRMEGDLGYLKTHLDRYGDAIRSLPVVEDGKS